MILNTSSSMDEHWECLRREALAIARQEHLFYDCDMIDLESEHCPFVPAEGDEIFGSHEPAVGNLVDLEDLFFGFQSHNSVAAAPAPRNAKPRLVVLSVYNPMQSA